MPNRENFRVLVLAVIAATAFPAASHAASDASAPASKVILAEQKDGPEGCDERMLAMTTANQSEIGAAVFGASLAGLSAWNQSYLLNQTIDSVALARFAEQARQLTEGAGSTRTFEILVAPDGAIRKIPGRLKTGEATISPGQMDSLTLIDLESHQVSLDVSPISIKDDTYFKEVSAELSQSLKVAPGAALDPLAAYDKLNEMEAATVAALDKIQKAAPVVTDGYPVSLINSVQLQARLLQISKARSYIETARPQALVAAMVNFRPEPDQRFSVVKIYRRLLTDQVTHHYDDDRFYKNRTEAVRDLRSVSFAERQRAMDVLQKAYPDVINPYLETPGAQDMIRLTQEPTFDFAKIVKLATAKVQNTSDPILQNTDAALERDLARLSELPGNPMGTAVKNGAWALKEEEAGLNTWASLNQRNIAALTQTESRMSKAGVYVGCSIALYSGWKLIFGGKNKTEQSPNLPDLENNFGQKKVAPVGTQVQVP